MRLVLVTEVLRHAAGEWGTVEMVGKARATLTERPTANGNWTSVNGSEVREGDNAQNLPGMDDVLILGCPTLEVLGLDIYEKYGTKTLYDFHPEGAVDAHARSARSSEYCGMRSSHGTT